MSVGLQYIYIPYIYIQYKQLKKGVKVQNQNNQKGTQQKLPTVEPVSRSEETNMINK